MRNRLTGLLAQPTYGALRDRVVAGDRNALDALAAIRTRGSASYLVGVVDRPRRTPLHEPALVVLRGLLPRGYLDGHLADALGRWPREKRRARYSFPPDRLVFR